MVISFRKSLIRTIRALFIMLALVVLAFSFGVVTTAFADDRLQLSGFASLGAGRLDRSDMPFLNYNDEWSFHSDSVIGGQAQYQLSSRFSVTGQAVARGFTFDDNDNFNPVLEWLFLSYQYSPEVQFRIGRMRTPLYFLSDSLEIGYSYPWVRPPVDTYTFLLSPIGNFNGADVLINVDLGESDLDVKFFAGESKGEYLSFKIEGSPVYGMNLVSHWDNLTVRYGITMALTDASSGSLDLMASAYENFYSQGSIFREIKESHTTENEWFQYHSLGGQWDYDGWSVIGETYVIVGPGKDFSNDGKGWYLSFSKQIRKFSPYIIFGYYKNEFSDEIANLIEESKGIVPVGSPYGLAGLDELRAFNLAQLENFNEGGRTFTAGIRYDFLPNAAFKFEMQHFSTTALLSRASDNQLNTDTESVLTSMVIDVVF